MPLGNSAASVAKAKANGSGDHSRSRRRRRRRRRQRQTPAEEEASNPALVPTFAPVARSPPSRLLAHADAIVSPLRGRGREEKHTHVPHISPPTRADEAMDSPLHRNHSRIPLVDLSEPGSVQGSTASISGSHAARQLPPSPKLLELERELELQKSLEALREREGERELKLLREREHWRGVERERELDNLRDLEVEELHRREVEEQARMFESQEYEASMRREDEASMRREDEARQDALREQLPTPLRRSLGEAFSRAAGSERSILRDETRTHSTSDSVRTAAWSMHAKQPSSPPRRNTAHTETQSSSLGPLAYLSLTRVFANWARLACWRGDGRGAANIRRAAQLRGLLPSSFRPMGGGGRGRAGDARRVGRFITMRHHSRMATR